MYKKEGFSLLELTITLVIISFLIVALLSMNSLASSFFRKKIIKEAGAYKNIFAVFYDSYSELPGDMGRGYQFFYDRNNCKSGIISQFKEKSCDGNRDKEVIGVSEKGNSTNHLESKLAFYHLFRGGFIKFNNKNDICEAGQIYPFIYQNISLSIFEQRQEKVSFYIGKGSSCVREKIGGIFLKKDIDMLQEIYPNFKVGECFSKEGKCTLKYEFEIFFN